MKTLKEFDYDLWATEENGTKRYFARVKATGEETEISLELMRVLMNEEKKMRRELNTKKDGNGDLLLDVLPDDETGESWLIDTVNIEADVSTAIMEDGFISLLTEKQRDVYLSCIQGGQLMPEYAAEHGTSKQAVMKTINQIREKAKKYFS